MKITRIDLWHVSIPLPAPFFPAWLPGLPQTENRFDLLRACTAGGLEGWAAAPRLANERDGFGSLLGPYFLGERADDIKSVRQRIREMGYLGYRCGWIEPACWDIIGKAQGKPVYELLGGGGGAVKAYASTGQVRRGNERIAEVEARLAEGFAAVKLRVHDDSLAEDVAQIRDTRAAVGDAAILGVDANQGWRVAVVADAPHWDYARAEAFCQEAEQQGFRWVEEPLAMDDYEGLGRLRAATQVKIAGGELNNQGLPEFRTMLARGCFDWYQPDATFTGGIAETWAIIQAVEKSGATYTPHTWTNGFGFAVNLQLFAAAPNRAEKYIEYPYDPPGWVPAARDGLLREPFLHSHGEVRLPTRPGLGFEIDRGALRRYGTRFFTATKLRVALNAVLDRGFKEARQVGATRDQRLARRETELTSGDAASEALASLVKTALS